MRPHAFVFPVTPENLHHRTGGIRVRELMAMLFMQAMIGSANKDESYDSLARRAVTAADALLEALEKSK